jgi:DNA (cytosine-5)-methyltransferase 1
MTFGSLFAGIGGLDLGLERAGMECIWQVEKDAYALKVLEKHWPNVKRYDDVMCFPQGDTETVDLICGGFPCQGISEANHNAKGLDDERSGLWFEFARILGRLRPRYAILENVSALTFRGLGRVLSDLSAIGFDAEWQTLPAQAFGAPHERERVFIVAYAPGERCEEDEVFSGSPFEATSQKQTLRIRSWPGVGKPSVALPNRLRWVPDSKLCRMVDGVPDGLDRYRVLGNAVVPQVAEWIGRRILDNRATE